MDAGPSHSRRATMTIPARLLSGMFFSSLSSVGNTFPV
jgi:hypothetical protein